MSVRELKLQKITLKPGERIPVADVLALVNNHEVFRFRENDRYERGENPKITDRPRPSLDAPDNRIRVSYARSIIDTVCGYMFKPGLITYKAQEEAYGKRLGEILARNRADLTTARLGRQAATFGRAFELHWTAPVDKVPRFAPVDPWEIVPLFDYSLDARLVAAIRHYPVGEETFIDVYYTDAVEHYRAKGEAATARETPIEPHYYGRVPLVIYQNADDWGGDFDAVKDLIDAYDILLSDSLNEMDRFASAYLVLKGLSMAKEDVKEAKYTRVLEMFEDGQASFLTKEIPSEFLSFAAKWIRDEIHRQSHVPDLVENAGDRLSGVALGKLLYGFENLAAGKEAYFRVGLEDRLALLGAIIGKTEAAPAAVDIHWGRNLPEDVAVEMEAFAGYADKGISTETLIRKFAPFVKDPKGEMVLFQKEVAAGLHPDLSASDAVARQLNDGSTTDQGEGEAA
jgi:Phage portal protein, SPP1 Gp6-like.